MFLDVIACLLLFIVADTDSTDISLSDHSFVSFKASFVICKNPSLSNSISISSVHLDFVLVLLVVYTTHVLFIVWW